MTNVEFVESLKYGLKLFLYLLGVVIVGGGGMVLGTALAGPELSNGVTDNLDSPELYGGLVLAVLGLVVWGSGLIALSYKLIADAVQWGVAAGTDSRSHVALDAGEQDVADTQDRTATNVQLTDATGRQQASASTSHQPGVSNSHQHGVSRSNQHGEPASHHPDGVSPQQRREIGPSPGEQIAREVGPASTVPAAEDVSDRALQQQPAPDHETDAVPARENHPQEQPDAVSEPDSVSESDETPTETATEELKSEPPEPTAEEIAFGGEDEPQTQDTATRERTENGREPLWDGDSTEETGQGTIPPYESVQDSSEPERDEQAVSEAETADTEQSDDGSEPTGTKTKEEEPAGTESEDSELRGEVNEDAKPTDTTEENIEDIVEEVMAGQTGIPEGEEELPESGAEADLPADEIEEEPSETDDATASPEHAAETDPGSDQPTGDDSHEERKADVADLFGDDESTRESEDVQADEDEVDETGDERLEGSRDPLSEPTDEDS